MIKRPTSPSLSALIALITLVVLTLATQPAGAHEGGHDDQDYGNSKLTITPGVYLNTLIGHGEAVNSELARGRHDPADNGLSIPSINLSTFASYGEHLTAYTEGILIWNEADGWDTELEELYLKAVNLPGGLDLKLGRILPTIGTRNDTHNYAWDFVDHRLGNIRFLGEAGLILEGGELSWTPATPWDDRLYVSFGNAIDQDTSRSSRGSQLTLWDRNIFSLRYQSTLWPSIDKRVHLGASYLQGDNFFDETSRLYEADITYTWFQNEDLGRKLTWANELMLRDIDTSAGDFNELSLNSSLNYHLNRRWEIGLRYDYLEGVEESIVTEQERHRISSAATRRFEIGSIESKVRLQYNYDYSDEAKGEHGIWLQLGFDWGYVGSGHRY